MPVLRTPWVPLADGRTLAQTGRRTGCRVGLRTAPARRRRAGGEPRGWATRRCCSTPAGAGDPVRPYARLSRPGARPPAAARLPHRQARRRAARRAAPRACATWSSTTRPTVSPRSAASRSLLALPGRGPGRGHAARRTTRCRRCCTRSRCTVFCVAAARATTRSGTSAARCTSSCAACAGPTQRAARRRESPGCSPGGRRPRSWSPVSHLLAEECGELADDAVSRPATSALRAPGRSASSTRRGAERRRRPRRAQARGAWAARPTRPCCWPQPWPCAAAAGLGRTASDRMSPRHHVVDDVDSTPAVEPVELPWPAPRRWLAAVAASPLVRRRARPLRLAGDELWLERYWQEEMSRRGPAGGGRRHRRRSTAAAPAGLARLCRAGDDARRPAGGGRGCASAPGSR